MTIHSINVILSRNSTHGHDMNLFLYPKSYLCTSSPISKALVVHYFHLFAFFYHLFCVAFLILWHDRFMRKRNYVHFYVCPLFLAFSLYPQLNSLRCIDDTHKKLKMYIDTQHTHNVRIKKTSTASVEIEGNWNAFWVFRMFILCPFFSSCLNWYAT